MASRFLLKRVYEQAGLELEHGAEAGPLTLRFRNQDGEVVAEGEAPPLPHLVFEHSDGRGGMCWSQAPLPIDVQDAPKEAVSVELLADGAVIGTADAPVMALSAIRPPQQSQAIRGSSGWHLRIISERFAAPARFFDACAQLAARMEELEPFRRPGMRWRVSAHFWPSTGPAGLFRTFDPPAGDRRVFGEDQVLAKAFLDSLGSRDMGLVLVDSQRRGGAGGVGEFWPSWSTIVSELNETWEDVTLHELGHAFGLADEYEANDLTVAEPTPLEPNVAQSFAMLPALWSDLHNAPSPRPTSSQQPPTGGWPPDTVGTFKGARYRPDRFRPSQTCRMRQANDQFCPVCTELIAARLQG